MSEYTPEKMAADFSANAKDFCRCGNVAIRSGCQLCGRSAFRCRCQFAGLRTKVAALGKESE
jgi:hypothetical protein